ncbi:Phytanoyl-CoA dioxygenase (PhyH) [Pseudomonas sp. 8Z]|uniref:phytanoyl-CoA dioxygenase family protein n=1 Tax=Pseudomonas sp. 8Z TaxID=2653166 RepID=UPI0012EF3376|nr:phytanoyl-CoA dioxygenase family protein [Pseudomonas sp. 8Z]VXC38399.1 Phytanoyl-CoA dioxygenase (PhyH) [Pseudomonas sp. 8Z]
MISKYRMMRGLLKRKVVRDFLWRLIWLKNLGKVQAYRKSLKPSQTVLSGALESEYYLSRLRSDGATLGPSLSVDKVAYLRRLADRLPCFADRNPELGFYLKDLCAMEAHLGKRLLLAQYLNIQDDPVVKQLSRDDFILDLAAAYLGATPKLMSANMWWTFPVDASPEDRSKHAHVFHYDLDDIKFVKFFFYLTDVDSESGPHVYVRTSNHDIRYKNSVFKAKRFTDEEVLAAYGENNIVEVCGGAGSCLIEDTITLHKGVTPLRRPRLLLQFEFSINTYPEMSCVVDPSRQRIVLQNA